MHRPAGDLQRFVREILWVRSTDPRTQALIPETGFTLVLRQAGTVAWENRVLAPAVISGLQNKVRVVDHSGGSFVIILRFTEIGAPALLHDRADLFFGRTAALDSVLPARAIDDVQHALAESPEIRGQIPIVERFLAARIRMRHRISEQIEEAARLIRSSGGRAPIAAIARRVGVSQSVLERGLRATAGTTPKMLARLARLQTVCRLWNNGISLTRIAFEAGYTDQPHLVRDFQLFAGMPPREFFRRSAPQSLPVFYK